MSNLFPSIAPSHLPDNIALLAIGFIGVFSLSFLCVVFHKVFSREKLFAYNACFMSIRPEAAMLEYMLRLRKNFKILNRIIQLVSVFMMDNFLRKRKKFSTKAHFHYMAMFKDSFTTDSYPYVATRNIPRTSDIVDEMQSAILSLHSVMGITISFASIFSITSLYFAQPLARIAQRIHTQTVCLYGEIRKGLLSYNLFPYLA